MIKKLTTMFFAAIFAALSTFADNSEVTLSFDYAIVSIRYHWSAEKPLKVILPDNVKKVTFSNVPSGLKYDAKTSRFLGTPKKPATYVITARMTDYNNRTVTHSFSVQVRHLMDADKMFKVRAENYYGFEWISGSRDRENHGYGTFMPFVGLDSTWYIPRQFQLTDSRNTLKLTGLPPGLKFNSKTYEITGAITKAGFYIVKATVTTPEKKAFVSTFSIEAQALPNWAVGTFNGMVDLGNNEFWQMTATVSANGNISAKMFGPKGTAWKYSGKLDFSDGVNGVLSSFSVYLSENYWDTPGKNGLYSNLWLEITQRGSTGVGVMKGTYQEKSPYASVKFALDQNPWTAKQKLPTPVFAKGLVHYITLTDGTYITHKFGSKGKVTVKCYAYKGAKKSTSCSATLSACKDGSYFRARLPYIIKSQYGTYLAYWWDFKIYGAQSLDLPTNRISADYTNW